MDALQMAIYGAPLRTWLVAAGAALVVTVALRLVQAVLGRRLRARAGAADTVLAFAADLVGRTALPVLVALGLYVGGIVAVLPATVEQFLRTLAVIAVLLQVAVWLNRLVAFVVTRHVSRDADAARATTMAFLGFLVRLALWTIILLVALDNLGVNVTALVAGLGIGGIAVALATQNILGDMFSSLSIVLDKPFVVGDFIVVDALSGHVQHIGLKTTRVRSVSGEEIIFANSDLLKSRIRNYRTRYERRVVFSVGVTPQTPHATLARIPSIVREIVEAQPRTRFERAHFARLADSALVFDVVYYVLSGDETTYTDVQHAINLALFARFERESIEFATPGRALEVRETAAAILPGAGPTSPS